MNLTTLDDPALVQKATEMKHMGMFVSDIAKQLSEESGKRITQMAIIRAMRLKKEMSGNELTELEYPSRKEIEECFSELLQKQENRICIYGGKQLKRNVMIEILNKFHNKEFTQLDVKKNLYKTTDGEVFSQHWRYLLEGNYIEKVDEYKFKFCDRVKQWKNFGKI